MPVGAGEADIKAAIEAHPDWEIRKFGIGFEVRRIAHTTQEDTPQKVWAWYRAKHLS